MMSQRLRVYHTKEEINHPAITTKGGNSGNTGIREIGKNLAGLLRVVKSIP